MTSIDKAAIAWTIGIVIAGVAFTLASSGTSVDTEVATTPPPVQKPAETTAETKTVTKAKITGYDRLTSIQDPGVGHETHQLAIILAPSEKVYSGTLRYDASEPIQLVSLVGPLKAGQDKGQPIWTPDGKTKFALTFVDPKKARGEWKFVGNALAVHTLKTTPFIVDYKVTYDEKPKSDTAMTGTVNSVIDPGVGHGTHSLAVIIPPSENIFTGTLSYSASEPIQLVSLRGPLTAGENPPLTWTPDGKTMFALTFVDPKDQMGTWEFSGNALALHTLNTNGFTASYAVSSEKKMMAMPEKTMPAPKEQEKAMEKEMAKPTAPKAAEVIMAIDSGISQDCAAAKNCYDPFTAKIAVGGTVTWKNPDAQPHTVTSGNVELMKSDQVGTNHPSGKGFDSGLVMKGQEYSKTFDAAGNYEYFCMVHPWMSGSVKVS